MKHLIIRQFGPIEEVDIDLKRINLIIGPQSSGKSCVLKIACFCVWLERQMELTQNPKEYCEYSFFMSNLIGFHKLEGYLRPDSYFFYETDFVSFECSEKDKKCNYQWKESKRWKYKRPKIAYIPAERNLVAAIPNWFQVSMKQDNILDFMKEWEFARKAYSTGENILDLPVKYKYNPSNHADLIKLSNGKELNLTVASSGLQSLIPLFIMLRYLTSEYFKEMHLTTVEYDMQRQALVQIVSKECQKLSDKSKLETVDAIMDPSRSDLYVEEPEAHIFPSTQKSFVYSLVGMLNTRAKHTYFLATHSPYIMTAFNNVILAGETAAAKEKAGDVYKLLPKKQTLRFDEVAAFEMKDGQARSIMDEESRLISAEAIDAASQEIGNDFDYLLSL